MSTNFYGGTPSNVLKSKLADLSEGIGALLGGDDDEAAWLALNIAERERRLDEAERLSKEAGLVNSELLARIDDDAPRRPTPCPVIGRCRPGPSPSTHPTPRAMP